MSSAQSAERESEAWESGQARHCGQKLIKYSGGDARRGNTRSHPEHDG